MNNRLEVYQSLWAMERRHTDQFEFTLEQNVAKIAEAGFDGVSASFESRANARTIAGLTGEHRLNIEGQCFPKGVDDLQPVLENAVEFGVHHVDLQPDVRPRSISEAVAYLDGWAKLSEQVDFPVCIETHRDRMTTDLFFTLDLLAARPDTKLLADLSHYVVAREFPWPISEENHGYIRSVLDHTWAFHGRVATREQIQIEISFPPHRPWVDLFAEWWRYGFESWVRRAADGASVAFTCELGPKPYAIIGADGNDTTDRWQESLLMKNLVREIWNDLDENLAVVPRND